MFFASLVKKLGRRLALTFHVIRKYLLKWSVYLFLLTVCSRMQIFHTRECHACSMNYIAHLKWRLSGSSLGIIQHITLEIIRLYFDSKHKSLSKTFNSVMIHANYKPTIPNRSNSIQIADPTFQIIISSSKLFHLDSAAVLCDVTIFMRFFL